jgi:hypothetical protein
MLFVDLWHWLDDEGNVPADHPQLRRPVLRIARFIEYAADLPAGWARHTLVECKKRPGRQACEGLMMVIKEPDERILALCPACGEHETLIQNWRTTRWGAGMPPAIRTGT